LLVACTPFTKTDIATLDLQRGIRAGEVIAPGDEIRVTTSDARVIELTVSAVTDDSIEGAEASVAIDSVQELEVRRFSPERAVAVGAGSVLLSWWLIGLLFSMIVVFPA
jgi:hypothetical protein